jgi:alkylated DNA repair dioxygenase AlkB
MGFNAFRSSELPKGFRYADGLVSSEAAHDLVAEIQRLPFKAFEFRGFVGKRRVVAFGWRYDFNGGGLQEAAPLPGFLEPLRDKVAEFGGLNALELQQVMVTEYAPGATIGWHKDRSVFAEVLGVSLLAPCTFRFRKKTDYTWKRASMILEPRSAYVLSGVARTEWEHSIPPVESLRYSITFRRLAR